MAFRYVLGDFHSFCFVLFKNVEISHLKKDLHLLLVSEAVWHLWDFIPSSFSWSHIPGNPLLGQHGNQRIGHHLHYSLSVWTQPLSRYYWYLSGPHSFWIFNPQTNTFATPMQCSWNAKQMSNNKTRRVTLPSQHHHLLLSPPQNPDCIQKVTEARKSKEICSRPPSCLRGHVGISTLVSDKSGDFYPSPSCSPQGCN